MNKEEYIGQLKEKLKKLPKEDFNRAIDYFEEYFAEAGMENEAQAALDLGSPQEAADKIIRDFAIDNSNSKEAKKNVKKGITGVWVAVLAVCASPIALPLLLTAVVLMFALILVVLVVLLAVGACGFACVIAAPLAFAGGFSIIFSSFPNFLVCMGMALISVALGIILIYVVYLLVRKFLYWIVLVSGRQIEKRRKSNENK